MLSPSTVNPSEDESHGSHTIQLPALSVTNDRIVISSQYKPRESGNPFEEAREVASAPHIQQ